MLQILPYFVHRKNQKCFSSFFTLCYFIFLAYECPWSIHIIDWVFVLTKCGKFWCITLDNYFNLTFQISKEWRVLDKWQKSLEAYLAAIFKGPAFCVAAPNYGPSFGSLNSGKGLLKRILRYLSQNGNHFLLSRCAYTYVDTLLAFI